MYKQRAYTQPHVKSSITYSLCKYTHGDYIYKKKKKRCLCFPQSFMCTEVMMWDLRILLHQQQVTQTERRDNIRRGSSAPLLHSPGGRPACTAPPPSHLPSAGRRFDGCCPCCPERCTCRSTGTFQTKRLLHHSWYVVDDRIDGGNRKNVFLPLIIENTVGHVQRPQERPDVMIRPVLQNVAEGEIE